MQKIHPYEEKSQSDDQISQVNDERVLTEDFSVQEELKQNKSELNQDLEEG